MKYFFIPIAILLLLSSCISNKRISQNFNLLQKGLDSVQAVTYKAPTIKPFDALSIQVYSKTINQEQVALFNLGGTSGSSAGSGGSSESGSSGGGYVVDEKGYITMPMIEKVMIAGLTIDSLRSLLKKQLSQYIKEVDVIAKFSSFKINVMGEVGRPGFLNVPQQRNNLLDVISLSGGLTELARRDSVVIIREDSGRLHKHIVDLRNANFINSEVYQLQQNDIVYVLPESAKLKSVEFSSDITLRKIQQYAIFAQLVLIPLTIYNIIRR